jgi:hypothetical protein
MKTDDLKQENSNVTYDVIVRLFTDLKLKYKKGDTSDILITLQDDKIIVMEQDYYDLMVLEEIPLFDNSTKKSVCDH